MSEGDNSMKYRILVLPIILCLLLVMSSCITFSTFDEMITNNEESTTAYEYVVLPDETTSSSVLSEQTTSVTIEETSTAVNNVIPEETTGVSVNPEATTATPVIPEDTTSAVNEPDYSSYTKKQIIDTYAEALKKTRGYTGALTVNHTESFDADIKEANPGGALTELLASNIVKLVGSEGQQTLNFNGGYATNADGETVPILLPQRTDFSLPEAGVSSAVIEKSGDKTKIRIVLVSETVSMGQVPTYNSTAIGYLDTSNMDFKIITISRVDITYPGSVIEAVIRSDGYIESVTYTINMSTYAELSGMGITGYGTLEGAQTEKWELNW